ncbi:unnamed protein product [Gordionus sp. m RMFG-2023]|uniref:uncharacterized protein LOC135927455 isoform X2 n=1 Tax=Gordionus sp. m RMFG-2023 TaxID=3053472 RepID=UPI0030E3CEDB
MESEFCSELILCYHGPLLYEAKILKKFQIQNEKKYYIHYSGWNKNWDEWVNEARILKLNPENILKQKELKLNVITKCKTKKQRQAIHLSKLKIKNISNEGQKTLKQLDNNFNCQKDTESDNNKEPKSLNIQISICDKPQGLKNIKYIPRLVNKKSFKVSKSCMMIKKKANNFALPKYSNHNEFILKTSKFKSMPSRRYQYNKNLHFTDNIDPSIAIDNLSTDQCSISSNQKLILNSDTSQVRIHIPEIFKPVLLDDWDYVTSQQMLVRLPCDKTISLICSEYLDSKARSGWNEIRLMSAQEFVVVLKKYFNFTLGSQLLYSFERPQYADVLEEHSNNALVDVYGCVHFLRLFVNLFEKLKEFQLSPQQIAFLIPFLKDLFIYLNQNLYNYIRIDDYECAPPDYYRKII